MAEFINTIEALGDEAVMDSIIDRSITEFKDNKLTNIGHSAFKNCTALKSVDLPNVTSISHATFDGCSSLESISMPNLETGQQNCFAGTAIKEINLPSLTSIQTSSFALCKSLERAILPNLTFIQNLLFNSCSALKDLYVPVATYINNGLCGCTSLEYLDLPKVTQLLNNAFAESTSIKAIMLRSESLCTLGSENAFKKDIYNFKQRINHYFKVYVPKALVESYKAATNWSDLSEHIRALEDYTVDGTITGELDNTKADIFDNPYTGGITYESDGTIVLGPLYGDGGDLPYYKMSVSAGQQVQITYHLLEKAGYVYDGRNCGSTFLQNNNVVNAETTITVDVVNDGTISFSGYQTGQVENGELVTNWKDRAVGKYIKIKVIG